MIWSAPLVEVDPTNLAPLPTTGLAHDHYRIGDTGRLLRVPKQSQLALAAHDNLAYQAACFARAAASDHTPRLHGLIEPCRRWPLGALVVDEIAGRPPRLPEALPAIAEALGAIHRLPLPPPADRPPLMDQEQDPLGAMLEEVLRQGVHLEGAGLEPEALAMIRAEIAALTALIEEGGRPPVRLISFDAHPGNFLLEDGPKAVLVDLEKGRYGAPGFDLAHASLYTSTTWDLATYAELEVEEVAAFYATWLETVPGALADASRPWLLPTRRLMWLWSTTWCAKWRVESARARKEAGSTGSSAEDWSADLSEPALVAHVRGRVDHYLTPGTIARVRREWAEGSRLTSLLEPSPTG